MGGGLNLESDGEPIERNMGWALSYVFYMYRVVLF